jgi:hypothetical protein
LRTEADADAFRILTLLIAVCEEATAALERLEPRLDTTVTDGIRNTGVDVYQLLMTETRFRIEPKARVQTPMPGTPGSCSPPTT